MNTIPSLLKPLFDNMPPELTSREQWVVWVAELLPDKGKYSKIPYDAKTGRKASSTDPTTWATFQQAKRAYERGNGRYAGIGFVLSESDPFTGVDLDNGTPQQDIDRWLSLLDSYAETSPSGNGIRIFVIGNLPPGDRKRGTVEGYETARFLTVTGHRIEGTPAIIAERQQQLEQFHREAFPPKQKPTAPTRDGGSGAGFTGDDTELLAIAFSNPKNGAKIAALYDGNIAGYPGMSEADLALLDLLAYYVGPQGHAQLDRLFRNSGLMRDKWDERHYANGDTYGQRHVDKAISGCGKFYTPWEPQQRTRPQQKRVVEDAIPDEPDIKKPSIIVSNRQDETIAAECWDAIHAANTPPKVFSRGGQLARLAKASDTGRIAIETMDVEKMLYRMRRVADFISIKRTKEEDKILEARAPLHIAKDIIEDVEQREKLPVIRTVVYSPVVGNDGTIIASPGYHAKDRVYLETHGLPLPPVSATREEAIAAYDRLFGSVGVFSEFPWSSNADKAQAAALLFTSFLRPYIAGNAPLALIEAPEQGSGKSLLARNLLRIFDPEPETHDAPSSRDPKDAEPEWTKVLVKALRPGPAVLLLDNLRGVVASQSLEGLLTAPDTYSLRVLGSNDPLIVWPCFLTIAATSNNGEMNRDMVRRSYTIRIDANMERPEERTDFRIPDLDAHVKAHRHELLTDVMTILSAWIQAGRPEGKAIKGSFQRWASVVSGILEFLSVPGFLEGESERAAYLDPETARWAAFFKTWHQRYSKAELVAKDLLEIAEESEVIPDRESRGASRSLGKMLSSRRDKIYAGLRLSTRTGMGGIVLFSLKEAKEHSGFSGFSGFSPSVHGEKKDTDNGDNKNAYRGECKTPTKPTKPTIDEEQDTHSIVNEEEDVY